MKYAILILTFIASSVFSASFAQDNSRNSDNFQRDRNNGGNRDRNFRRFDRNGGDTGRYDRTRPPDPPRETMTASAVAPLSAPASNNAANAEAELDPMPIENVSTNAGPVDPRSFDAFRSIATRNIFDPNRY